MKKLFKISMLIAMLCIVLASCRQDDDIKPPTWLQGKWGIENSVILEFTSKGMIVNGANLTTTYSYDYYKWEKYKDNGIFFELKFTSKALINEYAFFSFKKGDGTYIEWGAATNTTNIEEYVKLDKID